MIAVMLQDKTVSFHAAHDKSRLQDAATLRERAKIDLLRDEELAKFLPVRVAIVEIELADGTRLTERVSAVRGTPRNPMSRAEVIDKARDLTAPVLGRETAERLIETSSRSRRLQASGNCGRSCSAADTKSIQPELRHLAMLGMDAPHRAGDRAVDHRLRLDHLLSELDALQHRAIGDAPRADDDVARRQFVHVVFLLRIADAHFARTLDLRLGVEDEPRLHLPADTTQCARGKHAFRRAAGAEIKIDAGMLGLRRVDDAGDIPVGDEPYRRARLAARHDQVGMAQPVED